MSTCRLCRKDRRLIAAHIISESLYAPLRKNSEVPRIYSTKEGSFPKRSPTGIYDSELLCAECDNRIGDWDNYAKSVLLQPLDHHGEPVELRKQEIFVIHKPDYHRLKLFFISLLWRADQSAHQFFSFVKLGTWSEKARLMVLNADPGTANEFGVVLVRYEHPLAIGTIHQPEPTSPGGINYYRFSLGSYVAMIKVDKRPFEPSLDQFLLRPDADLLVCLFEYEDSKLYADVAKNIGAGAFKLRRRR